MNLDVEYFRIDSKNTFTTIDEDYRVKQTMRLYTTLAADSEESIGKEMNKFFLSFLVKNQGDLLEINQSLLHKHKAKNIYQSMDEMLNTYYNDLQLDFDQKTIDVISDILLFSFEKIQKYSSSYNIKTHADFLSCLFYLNYKDVDIIREYISNERSYSGKKKKRKNSLPYCNGASLYQQKQHGSFSSFSSKSDEEEEGPKTIFKYHEVDVELHGVPNELIILINKVQYIKRLIFHIEDVTENDLIPYIIVLLNAEWLFPNLIEIEFDLTSNTLNSGLDRIFQTQLVKKMKEINKTLKRTTYDSYTIPIKSSNAKANKRWDANVLYSSTFNRDSKIDNSSSRSRASFLSNYTIDESSLFSKPINFDEKNDEEAEGLQIIKDNICKLDMIVIYSYFISKWKNIRVLMLRFPDGYTRELEVSMAQKGLNLVNINFMNFFVDIDQLADLSVEFNALDVNNFEKVLGMININRSLKILRLSLFSDNKDYSPSGLYKLCYGMKKNLKFVFDERKKVARTFINDDIDHLILWKLLDDFQKNLENLFCLLLKKRELIEFVLVLDLPSILVEDEKYEMSLIKFLLNLFLFIANDTQNFKTVKIIAPLLLFDTRKYPIISEVFQDILSIEEEKKYLKKIRSLTIQLKMFSFPVESILTTSITTLFLGDLDVETFKNFVNYFSNPRFLKESSLMTLKLSIGYCVVNYSDMKEYIERMYKRPSKDLGELFLFSNLIITSEDIEYLLDITNFNCVAKYLFEFHNGCGFDYDTGEKKRTLFWTSKTNSGKTKLLSKKLISKIKIFGKKDEKEAKENRRMIFTKILSFFLNKKEVVVQTKEQCEGL